MRLGFGRRDLGENAFDINLLAAFRALVQMALGIQRGEFFGKRTAGELMGGDALVARQTLGMFENGVGELNAQGAHVLVAGIRARSCGGVMTRMPNEAAPSKSEML